MRKSARTLTLLQFFTVKLYTYPSHSRFGHGEPNVFERGVRGESFVSKSFPPGRRTTMTTLRHGFTTGTAAAAAAKAAALFLASGMILAEIDVPLPTGGRLTVPVARVERAGNGARGIVVKDAGDDPDVTHGAEIHAVVRLTEGRGVEVSGGAGVGRVTLPGLPVEVGQAAINPDPMRQIEAAVGEALGMSGQGARVVIEVPRGEELAAKTMNPRLGIVGGISILGTRGTVVPFSHESWRASVLQALDVARAQGFAALGLATGRRSSQWLARETGLPQLAVVEMADFYAFALENAAAKGFGTVHVGCMIGKLIKHALGLENTHARHADLDFSRLAGWCDRAGLDRMLVREIEGANTGRQVLQLVQSPDDRRALLDMLTARAVLAARKFAGHGPDVEYHVYDYGGGLLAKATNQGDAP